ncbi:hypothetical protein AgCh_035910 [Apium graveolens]
MDSAKLEVLLNEKCLCYNEDSSHPKVIRLGDGLERNHISALMTTIYQIGSKNEEMKQVKAIMFQVLRNKEEKLISSFVKNHFGFRLTRGRIRKSNKKLAKTGNTDSTDVENVSEEIAAEMDDKLNKKLRKILGRLAEMNLAINVNGYELCVKNLVETDGSDEDDEKNRDDDDGNEDGGGNESDEDGVEGDEKDENCCVDDAELEEKSGNGGNEIGRIVAKMVVDVFDESVKFVKSGKRFCYGGGEGQCKIFDKRWRELRVVEMKVLVQRLRLVVEDSTMKR